MLPANRTITYIIAVFWGHRHVKSAEGKMHDFWGNNSGKQVYGIGHKDSRIYSKTKWLSKTGKTVAGFATSVCHQ